MKKALKFVLAGGVAAAALVAAAPASAQYYPGYPGYGYGSGNVIGQVLNSVLGGGYGGYGYNGYGAYGANSGAAVGQCTNAVQARLGGYGGYGAYGYAGGGARVLGVTRVEPRSNGGMTVRGVASSGRYGADLTWKCKVDYRGYISDIDVDRNSSSYGYNNGYTGYGYDPYNPYAQYGYRRY